MSKRDTPTDRLAARISEEQTLSTNELIRARQLEILKAKELPEMPPIKEFREAPDAREYVRRYQLWELLGWYEHEVVRPNRGLKGFLRRLWWRVTGQKVKLMSPFQQLIYRDRALALQQARKEVEERAESQGL